MENLKIDKTLAPINTEDKKYILTNETVTIDDIKYHRIVAIKNFSDVKVGDLGGWVDCEKSLSHHGDCWVYNNAKVSNSRIMGNTCVKGNAELDHVQVTNSEINGDVFIKDTSLYKSYVAGTITVKKSVIRDSKITGHGYMEHCGVQSATIKNLPDGEGIRDAYIGKHAMVRSMWDVVTIDNNMTFYKGVDGKIYRSGESIDTIRENLISSSESVKRILKLFAGVELMLS